MSNEMGVRVQQERHVSKRFTVFESLEFRGEKTGTGKVSEIMSRYPVKV